MSIDDCKLDFISTNDGEVTIRIIVPDVGEFAFGGFDTMSEAREYAKEFINDNAEHFRYSDTDNKFCPHKNQHTIWNDLYLEHREHTIIPMGMDWAKVGETICEDCGNHWNVYQAPGLFD